MSNVITKPRNNPNMVTVPEAASQSFRAGDFVTLNSGKAAVLLATSTSDQNVTTSSTSLVFGVATHRASGTTDEPVNVEIAHEDTEYVLPVYHATPANAVSAVNNVGVTYVLTRVESDSTSGLADKWAVGIATTTNGIFEVTGLVDPAGTSYGLVRGRIVDGGRII